MFHEIFTEVSVLKHAAASFALVLLILLCDPMISVNVVAQSQPPSLTLFTPEVDGWTVTVDGVTMPSSSYDRIIGIHWDWGDGRSEDHWFPASHTYGSGGTYTIYVTAIQNDGKSTTKSVTVSVWSGVERFEIAFVSYPGSVGVRATLEVWIDVDYSLGAPTTVTVDIYENAGPVLSSTSHHLSGTGEERFILTITAPSAPRDSWQLNIHLQGDYKKSIYIRVEPSRGIKVCVYAIDDSMRQNGYNIEDATKIAGAQIRVEYLGSSHVLTTGSDYPGPCVEVDENSEVAVAFVQNPPGWTFANHWDIYMISWTDGDSRTFNVGTSDKHVCASFNPVLPSSYWVLGVIFVALAMSVVALAVFKFHRGAKPQPRPKETLDEDTKEW